MAGLKNDDNKQFALVSEDGTRPVPQAAGTGIEPLADQHGKLWTLGAPAPFPFPGFPTRNQLYATSLVNNAELFTPGPGILEQVNGFVDGTEGTPVYVQLWDIAAWPPGEGDSPFEIPPIDGLNTYAYGPASGWRFENGLFISFSLNVFGFNSAGDVGFYNCTLWTP